MCTPFCGKMSFSFGQYPEMGAEKDSAMAELDSPTPEKRHGTIRSMIRWSRSLLVGIGVLTLLFVLLWEVPKWQVAGITEPKDRLAAESACRQTLVQLVGGVALLGGLYFTAQTLRTSQETLRTTQQGQITERFTKAIEQLGDKERLTVRLGGIYASERIARDSESDHWGVMEVLTAFVREQAPATTLLPDNTSGEEETKKSPYERKPPSDIQAILTVIGRRTRTFGNGEAQRLDFHNTNLQGANLGRAQLQGANLGRAQLQGADLGHAQLQGANLGHAQLQGADLGHAQLQGANLGHAQCQGANLGHAQLQGAVLRDAQLQGANLGRAQLQGADLGHAQLQGANLWEAQLQSANLIAVQNLTQSQLNTACIDENTKLPEGLTKPAPCPANP